MASRIVARVREAEGPKAHQEALSAQRTKADFLAVVSDEIRMPLSSNRAFSTAR